MEGVLAYTTAFAGNFAPQNWALCQGQIVPIAQNTALFSLLGVNFGGNGTSNFGLPDLRGRSVVGAGSGPGLSNYIVGQSGGVETTTINQSQMAPHVHPVQVTITPNAGAAPNSASPAGAVYATSTNSLFNFSQAGSLQNYQGTIGMANQGTSQPFPVIHPVLGLNYVICLYGTFPARN